MTKVLEVKMLLPYSDVKKEMESISDVSRDYCRR